MKKIVCISILIILFLFCGCSDKNKPSYIVTETFSYTEVADFYKDFPNPGIKRDGFINTKKSVIENADDVVELAKKECKIEYDTINVAFDEQTCVYKVCFWETGTLGGNQNIYIDSNGITLLSVCEE